MKNQVIYILMLLILVACGQTGSKVVKKENIRLKNDTSHVIAGSISPASDTLAIPGDTIPKVAVPADAIQVVTNANAITDTTDGIKTVQCASYGADDVDANIAKLKWKGLFETKGNYFINDTRVKFTQQHSDLDTGNANTGWRINSNIKANNVILISGAKGLVNGPVKMALLSKRLPAAGQKLQFTYNGVSYVLYTTGRKTGGLVYNYKLHLLANVKGKCFNQVLKALPADVSFGGVGDMSEDIAIDFAGDIDGDNIPDFIISRSGYSYGYTELYLSRPAGSKAILKLVSESGVSD
ncbi:hypothetical protein [Mucilaginibacter sp.]|uniref:hypothetical protein n=1 Tax=Mucilaginibacter sp. TaxID=1882438 RepID=UPI0025FDB3DD|nr:hypothetical protein [Mucilaginibacter sp.]